MKIIVAGSKIICSRKDNTSEDVDSFRQVVAFDAHLRRVPSHVAERLAKTEIAELEQFLADRKHIQANPTEAAMLEVLPELIAESTVVLGSVDELNESMYQRLCSSVASLTEALRSVRPRSAERVAAIRSVRESEALKERFENIKQDI